MLMIRKFGDEGKGDSQRKSIVATRHDGKSTSMSLACTLKI